MSNGAPASYRPKGYGISPGLQRARLRFRFRNVVTGIAVASFMVGVWAYSISAVKQNVFDDVDEEARALNATSAVIEEPLSGGLRVANVSTKAGQEKPGPLPGPDTNALNRPRGIVFAALGDKCPWLFEPSYKTLVWGAPPVDHPGRIQDKIVVAWKR